VVKFAPIHPLLLKALHTTLLKGSIYEVTTIAANYDIFYVFITNFKYCHAAISWKE